MSARAPHILMTTDGVGGVWRYSFDLASGLTERGWKVNLLCLGPPPVEVERKLLEQQGVSVETADLPLDWLASSIDELRGAATAVAMHAQQLNVDSVHLHSPAYAVSPRYLAPVVAVNHSCLASWWQSVRAGEMPADFRWRAQLHREGIGAVDRLVCPSNAFARVTQEIYRLEKCPLAIWNGRRRSQRHAERLARVKVLTTGRLWDDGKNVSALERAAAGIKTEVFAAGAATDSVGHRAAFKHIRCFGHLDEGCLGALLAQHPIYVSPALYEPFGLGVLEAAQWGCPLVLSDIASFRELWSDAAIFIAPHAHETIACVVNELLADPVKHKEWGLRARRRAELYSAESMVARVADLHCEVLQTVWTSVGAIA